MRSPVFACLCVLVTAALAAAQRPSTFRCRHVLAEDGASWREDQVVTYMSGVLDVKAAAPGQTVDRDFGEAWLIPGLIDLHTHLLLRPYDEMSWDDQVRNESDELRSGRAVQHALATLRAGFTVIRDLGTEGAGYADVALLKAFPDEIVGGLVARPPWIIPATRAIVLRGCYGPDAEDPTTKKGAQCVAGIAEIEQAVREQAAGGAKWIKVYADYRHGKSGPVAPTFSLAELQALCAAAAKAKLPVAAHATTDEGIRRAVLAGVRTIEHGAGASAETLAQLKAKDVALCPCLAANEAIVRYAGRKGPIVDRLNTAKAGFQRALAAGVTVACGSDAGVFRHGDNAREIELMVDYGMTPVQALAAATRTAAQVLGRPELGDFRKGGAWAGLVVLAADPLRDIGALRKVVAVIRGESEVPLK
ncbi:MAG: amidohydrolase family protein [Planctomycetota bacterium]